MSNQRLLNANKLHDNLVLNLYRRPEILGLERSNVATATTEYEFRKDWQIYVCPDIAYMMNDGKYVFCEVKSTPSRDLSRKARKQMSRIYDCCMDLGLEAEGVIVQPTVRSSNLERLIQNLRVEHSFTSTKGL